ncbi:hypothetical protein HNR46_004247 [Haloferula luteola]|uniref:Uncharacterized protein n=1 Tax=Haloferula luteola TaxID=595692 RepID=A0A840VA64_9BACT|nr:hypothetical protein [Haloferula luteola]MBB5353976.1 hypothetical protein [Haloferula luteola]
MGLSDTAKDAIRLATTAGLGKDVIDLLTQKVTLLDEKLIEANLSLEQSRLKISELIAENKELRGKLNDSAGIDDGLDDECRSILFYFFETDQGFTIDQIARHFDLHPSVAKAHFDVLSERRLVTTPIRIVTYGSRPSPSVYTITSAGRALAMAHRKQ